MVIVVEVVGLLLAVTIMVVIGNGCRGGGILGILGRIDRSGSIISSGSGRDGCRSVVNGSCVISSGDKVIMVAILIAMLVVAMAVVILVEHKAMI